MKTDLVLRPNTSLADATRHFAFHATSVELVGDPTEEEWSEVTLGTIRMYQRSQWIIGDLLLIGERRYGETYAQVVDVTGYSPQTLANICSVNSRIPPERRRETLSWAHHAAVAYLEADEQEALLDQAEKHGLSSKDLQEAVGTFKKALKNGGALPLPPAPNPTPATSEVTGAGNIGARETDLFEQAAAKADPPIIPSQPVEKEQVEMDVDPIREWERAEGEVERLTALVETLQSGDVEKEYVALQQKYAQLEGRLQQEMETANQARKSATAYGNLLGRLRKMLKVETNGEVAGAVLDLLAKQ